MTLDTIRWQIFCHQLCTFSICCDNPVISRIMPAFVSKLLQQGIDCPCLPACCAMYENEFNLPSHDFYIYLLNP
nr:MAG TPA: hypothetical protein [Caudoviricetes sp.]